MADNYLERKREDYERRKAEWIKHGRRNRKKQKEKTKKP